MFTSKILSSRLPQNKFHPPKTKKISFQNDSFFVVARFDLNKTRTELLIAVIVPSCMFVISLTTLVIITRSVQVGDDAKMRCRYCIDKQSNETEGEGLVENSAMSTTPPQARVLGDNSSEVRSMAL